MRGLRVRLALGVGLVIAVVLGASGYFISSYTEREARDSVDDRLQRTAELGRATALEAIAQKKPDGDRRLNAVLNATGSSIRIFVRQAPVLNAGREQLRGMPGPVGIRTVTQDGERYRVLVTTLQNAGLGALGKVAKQEVTTSLQDAIDRQDALDDRLWRLGIVALLLSVLGAYAAAVRVLLPLRRLRLAVRRIAAEEDLTVRVSETDGPGEVRGLAASFNAMLARIGQSAAARERALEATRRFAADAGHELRTPLTTVQATLSALHRHPEVQAEQRTAMLGDALDEQARLVTLLDGLQALARGDASSVEPEDVDLGDLVELVAAESRDRHPGTTIETDLADEPVVRRGWPPGLRLLIGNLVENAAHHGRPQGRVRVTLTGGPEPVLTVDDDGDGIPEADRERVFMPFARLDAAAERSGSGLGLALVAQQAREAGATVSAEDSPLGGARMVVRFGS